METHIAPDNLFGTDGIRGPVGSAPLCTQDIMKIGSAIGLWAHQKYHKKPTALIAHDTRSSCSFIKAALSTGLLPHNVTLYDAHILPTPAVCKLIEQHSMFDFGIIISASHNPYYDNGIKLVDARNGKLTLADEHTISALFYQPPTPTAYDTFGFMHTWPEGHTLYINSIIAQFPPQLCAGLTIVLDCANGATYEVAPAIFKALGAHVIVLNAQPNGTNINQKSGSLYPDDLAHAVVAHNGAIGFAFDGDGDRITTISKYGEIKNGDDILALLSQHPTYKNESTIVGTIMSNEGLASFLKEKKKQLLRTPVGDKYISQQLAHTNGLLGGEQSGHIILRDYLATGDGIFTALRLLQTVIATNNWALHSFEKYPQLLINIPVKIKKDLAHPALAAIINTYKAQLPHGRVEVRYSGTENILRVMIEDSNKKTADYIGTHLANDLKKELT